MPAKAGITLFVEALVRIRTLLLPALVAVLLAVGATAAQADTFTLTLEDVGTSTVVVVDGDSNDFAGPDSILFIGTVGGFNVTVNGDALPPDGMNLLNFIVSAPASGGEFKATLSRTGLGPLWGSYKGIAEYGARFEANEFGIVPDASVTFQSWIDPSNSGNTGAGQVVFDPVGFAPGSFGPATVTSDPVTLVGDFSLVSQLDFVFATGGSVTANTDLRVAPVPEPTTLLLFGPGMLGFAALRRRLRSKAL